MSSSSITSTISIPDEHLMEWSKDKLLERVLLLQKANSKLDSDNRRLKRLCNLLKSVANRGDHVVSEAFHKIITQLESQLESLEPDDDDIAKLQGQIDELKLEKIRLENELEQESEHIVLKLNREKATLQEEAQKLKQQLNKAWPDHSQEMLHHLAEEVVRLRSLLVDSGRAHDDNDARTLEDLAAARQENLRLKRKVTQLQEKVHHLERAQAEIESSSEIEDERLFNLSRSDSPRISMSQPIPLSSSALLGSMSSHSGVLSSSPSSTFKPPPYQGRQRTNSNASSVSLRSGAGAYSLEHHQRELGVFDTSLNQSQEET